MCSGDDKEDRYNDSGDGSEDEGEDIGVHLRNRCKAPKLFQFPCLE